MAPSQVNSLILDGLTAFGGAVFIIIGAVLTIGIAYLVFRLGLRAINNVLSGSYGEAFNLHGESSHLATEEDKELFFLEQEEDEFERREAYEWSSNRH